MIDEIRALVRPVVSLAFVGVTLVLAYQGKLDAKEVLTITSIIVAFYFGERSALKKPEEEKKE